MKKTQEHVLLKTKNNMVGGLGYISQLTSPMLGTKTNAQVITGATLTATYAGNVSAALKVGGASQHTFMVAYTAGTNATALNLKLEYSGDQVITNVSVNWFQETAETIAAGTTTESLQVRLFNNGSSLVAGTTYKFRINAPVADMFVRISAQETLSGGTAFGNVYVELINSGA